MMPHTQTLEEPAVRTFFQMKDGPLIIPFAEPDGTINFSDTHLAQVFRRIVREETLDKVFYDGSITNTFDFINFFHNRENEVFFVEHQGREAGFFWLNPFRHKSAFITYCFYREFWGKTALEISRSTLDFLFSRKNEHNEHQTDVLLGLTPATNKLAVKFLLKNGMTILGKVPGILYDERRGGPVDGLLSYRQRHDTAPPRFPAFFLPH